MLPVGGLVLRHSDQCQGPRADAAAQLTFVVDLEATVGAAVICGEEQVEVVAAAEQELGDLGAVEGADEWRQNVGSIVKLQEVIIELRLKSARVTR